jgi:hypothetical protein
MSANTKFESQLSTRQQVYNALTREDEYAQGWAGPNNSRKADAYVSAKTGRPFTEMEWIIFAEKYLNEAKEAYANYVPDMNAVNIRLLKAASLLVSALTTATTPEQLEQIAGISSTKFPINRQGLKDYLEALQKDPKTKDNA